MYLCVQQNPQLDVTFSSSPSSSFLHFSLCFIQALERRAQLQHACANHETVEKLGRVSGELEIMRRRLRENIDANQLEVLKTEEKIAALEEELRLSEITRRKLHNTIQELRGNVRVFARVRPFLPSDGIDNR